MEQIITFLQDIPFWYWWVLAVILLLMEVMTGSTYLLWPASASVFTGLSAIWPLQNSWQGQCLVFTALTIALTLFAAPRVRPWLNRARQDHQLLNERGARKIGRKVSADGDFSNGVGKIRLDDTLWLAETDDHHNPVNGAALEITRVEGTKVYVKALG